MADIGIGALGYVGYAEETTEGVGVDPTLFLAASSVNWDDSNDYDSPLQITGSRDYTLALAAPYMVTGSLEMLGQPHDTALLLKSAFAASVGTAAYATGAYQHTFTPGGTSPTFTFETSYTGSGGDETLIMRHTGVRVNTLEIRAAFGEPITWSFGLDGVDRYKRPSGVATPSYDAESIYPFIFNYADVSIAGSASTIVKEYTFGVNNNVEHIGTLRKERAYKRVAMGARELSLSMSLDFTDATEYDRFLNDSEFAVSLDAGTGQVLSGAAANEEYGFTIALPRVRYRTVGIPLTAGDFITQDIECIILKPVGSDIATITLRNDEDGTLL
jgi:hypothetical protein